MQRHRDLTNEACNARQRLQGCPLFPWKSGFLQTRQPLFEYLHLLQPKISLAEPLVSTSREAEGFFMSCREAEGFFTSLALFALGATDCAAALSSCF